LANVKRADSHWQKLWGLMFKRSLPASEALLLDNCRSIHSCFMRINIDVIFVDKSGTIVYLIDNMQPWQFSKFVRRGRAVLECPPGTIQRHGLQINDKLTLRVD
jgi:uncharacterized membrane protein (UPF0127 family)